jgi:hypothetical protein
LNSHEVILTIHRELSTVYPFAARGAEASGRVLSLWWWAVSL